VKTLTLGAFFLHNNISYQFGMLHDLSSTTELLGDTCWTLLTF